MERRVSLYVSRKHPATWLMGVLLLASMIARILVFSQAPGIATWRQIVRPCVAIALFLLIAILCGKEMLYKAAIPIWMLGICYGWQMYFILAGRPVFYGMVWICIAFFCGSYTSILAGRRKPWLLLPLELAALGTLGYIHLTLGRNGLSAAILLPEYLLLGALFVMLFALKVHTDGKYHPTWGDRIDGRQVRTAQVMEQITAYFMPNRTGANNLFSESAEITELERYIRQKRKEGLTGFSITHAVLAAYVRTVAKYPALNRFIAGQRIYSRGEDIAVCMTVKKELTVNAPDSLIKVHLHPGDTAADVYHKFNAEVEKAKREMETTADATVAGFMMIPRLVLKFAIWLLKCLDYFGLVPKFLLEISPFHGSIYFTNLGSLGIKPVHHHLYDFGTAPAFCAFGRKRRVEEIKDGQIVERKYLDMTFNLDERICDGFYYASVIKCFLRLLTHPESLDTPPDVIETDIP